jgi:hypothetical protein
VLVREHCANPCTIDKLRLARAAEPRGREEAPESPLIFGIFMALRRLGTSTHPMDQDKGSKGRCFCALDMGGVCHLASVGWGGYTIDDDLALTIYRQITSRRSSRCREGSVKSVIRIFQHFPVSAACRTTARSVNSTDGNSTAIGVPAKNNRYSDRTWKLFSNSNILITITPT